MTAPDSGLATFDLITSRWPLPATGVRFLTPQPLVTAMTEHALSRDLYPLAFGFYPHAHGHRIDRHSHATHLLIYCTAGRGTLHIDGIARPVKAGDLMILRSGQRHAYASDPADPWSILWVHYAGELSGDYNGLFADDAVITSIGVQARLTDAFKQLLSLRNAGFSLPRFVQGACLLKALLTDCACASAQRPGGARAQLDMEKLTAHMEASLGRGIDVDALAATVNLSKYHFIRRFREHTGHAPIQRFIQMRMQRACELLDTTDKPVKAIAGEVGYQDAFYFSRIFKRTIGVSPQQYREQHAI